MGRKRANRQPGRVTGKEGAIHLDDWLDGPEDDYIDFEDNPAYSGTGGSMGINRKLTRREKKAMEKAAKEAEKLRKIQEEADRKAKLKAAREAEKAAKREAARQKAEKKKGVSKKKAHPASAVQKYGTRNAAVHKGRDTAKEKKQRRNRFPHSSPFPTGRWQRTGSAGCRINIIPRPSGSMILIISWHRMRIKMPFLKIGAISLIILTVPYISSYLL